jgi:hypothetical protein
MTDKQPEALRLADGLEQGFQTGSISAQLDQAAAELRRLHEVNAELVEALEKIGLCIAHDNPKSARNIAAAAYAYATGEQQ